jgi:hypothetical protein
MMMQRFFSAIFALFLGTAIAHAANTTAWVAGAGGLTWSSGTTYCNGSSDVNSMANGNAVLCGASTVTNGTNLDIYMDASIVLGSETTGSGSSIVYLYVVPLDGDGSTYGDGKWSTAAGGSTVVPQVSPACAIPLQPSTTLAPAGLCQGIVIPPGTFKIGVYNQSGAAFASSGNNLYLRFYDIQLNR